MNPPASEPMPSSPSSGSGEAVCGSLFCAVWVPWAFWSAAAAFCPAEDEAFWSPEAAFCWSAEVDAALLLADWSVAAALLLAEAFCPEVVVVEVAVCVVSVLVLLCGAAALLAALWSVLVTGCEYEGAALLEALDEGVVLVAALLFVALVAPAVWSLLV